MKKKISLKKIAISTVLLMFCYIGFLTYNQSENENIYIENKREAFNKYLDNHPYNNPKINYDDIKKLAKQDRPDLAAEQNYLMMVDPKSLTVPYNEVALAFNYTTKRLNQIKQFNNIKAQNSNTIKNNGKLFYEENSDIKKISEAITVGGNPIVWKERGPDNVGGRTRAILWDPNDATNRRVFAAGVTGGIWVNDNILDPNSSWRVINDFLASLAVNTLVADPNNPQIFYAGTGEGWFGGGAVRGLGIFKSIDGGNTWNLLPSTNGEEFAYVQKVQVTSTGTIIAATRAVNAQDGGIFRSADAGTTFTRVLNTRGADIEIASNNDIYASRGIFSTGTIFKSSDDGVNWTDVTPSGGTNPARIEIATAPSNANVVYAMAHNASDNTIDWVQKTEDAGTTWTNLTIPQHNDGCSASQTDITRNQAWYDLILAVNPANPDVIIAGGVDLGRSEDGGQTWTQISEWFNCSGTENVHADHHAIVFRPDNPNEALFGNDGGIYYSTDIGAASTPTFESRDKNYTTTQFYAVATDNISDSDYYIGGAQDNGTHQLRSDLNLSSVEVYGGDGAFTHVDQLDRTYQLVSSQNGRSGHSSNGGASFTRLNTLGTGNFINQSDYDNTSGILYSAAAVDEIAIITNVKSNSPSTEAAVSINIGGRQISAIRANTFTSNRLFIGTEGGRVYRLDNANTATPLVTEITNNISALGNVSSIDVGTTDMELIVTYSNFGIVSVWYSTDGGSTWVNKDDSSFGLPNIPIRWALFNPTNTNQVLLATELGVWSTNDITAANPEWEPSNQGLANVRCDMIQYRASDGMIVVATHGRGFYTSNIFANDDVSAPTIISLNPSDDKTLVSPLDTNLEVQFDEAINIGTGNIKIYLSSDDSLIESIAVGSNQVNLSGSRAIINPTNKFLASSSYYVQIDSGAFTDYFNNVFPGITNKTTWNFSTFDGDESPVVVLPIPDFTEDENSSNKVVDLTTVFNDVDNDNTQITYSLLSNSNSAIVNATITGSTLTLSFLPNKIGSSIIVIQATSNGKTVEDTFNVVVNDTSSSIFAQAGPSSGSGLQEGTYNDAEYRNVDDFTVPGGQNWNISTITTQAFSLGSADLNLQSVEVIIYSDNLGTPNTNSTISQQTILANQGQIIGGSQNNTPLTVRLNNPVDLTSGTYWVSIHPTFNVSFGSSSTTGLYAWFRSDAVGNALISVSNGAFSATNREMLFALNGAITITDAAPEIANPLADVNLSEIPNTNPLVLDLSSTFTDSDNDDSLITIEVIGNTNTSIVSPSISGKDLSLNFTGDFGATSISVRATSNGLTVEDSFDVSLLSTLYSQIGTSSGTSPSQIITDFSNASIESADDFSVPANETWNIIQVSVEGTISNGAPQLAQFKIYEDNNGFPGSEIFDSGNLTVEPTNDSSDFKLTLTNPQTLSSGKYWISVQTIQAFSSPDNNQWFWSFATATSPEDYVRQDPNDLLSSWSSTWETSGNNGALIFSLFGKNNTTLSTSSFNEDLFRLLSNPTDGAFEIQIGSAFNTELTVEVYDFAGRMIKQQSVDDNELSFTVDLRNQSNGVYLMKILNEGKIKTFKIIKK